MHACTYSTTCERSTSIMSLSFHFAIFPMVKRCSDDCARSSSSSGKHKKTWIDPKWATDFPWVNVSDNSGGCFARCVESTIASLKS